MRLEAESWRHDNIGRLLNNAVRRFEMRVFELIAAAGYPEIRLSHLGLTRNLDQRGTRVTELALRAAMTKQAMSELAVQCEKLGLIYRVQDPDDARAKIVLFTDYGLKWLKSFKRAIAQAEAEMCAELGVLRVDGLKTALAEYGKGFDQLGHENGK